MTLYATPGSTPNNTSPFQGTTPGNTGGQAIPGIPPNMSVLAAISAGLLPINAQASNFGATSASAANPGSGGRVLAAAMSQGNEMGNGQNGLGELFNSDSNGGSGPGAGQANQTEGPSSGQTSQVAAQYPMTLVTVPATPIFQG